MRAQPRPCHTLIVQRSQWVHTGLHRAAAVALRGWHPAVPLLSRAGGAEFATIEVDRARWSRAADAQRVATMRHARSDHGTSCECRTSAPRARLALTGCDFAANRVRFSHA